MRHLRWKQKFISGFSCLDQSKRHLYQQLQTLQSEMGRTEHCQDMLELMDQLNEQAHSLLETKVPNQLPTHVAEIGRSLDQYLPLAALDTPACRACSVCDRTEVLLHDWLEAAEHPDNDSPECAA